MENLEYLVKELVKSSTETECVEFKKNNDNPDEIGEYISALGNSATYHNKNCSYLIWGIDDVTHEILGTTFDYRQTKIGAEELENWLRRNLSDNTNFEFHEVNIDEKHIVVLIVFKATNQPIKFKNEEFIRIGSYKKKLKDFQTIEAQLWDRISHTHYEDLLTKQDLHKEDILHLLDYDSYFDLTKTTLPSNTDGILHYLTQDGLIIQQDNGLYAITNLGAILYAKRLSDFSNVSRKAIRVVQYSDNNKLNILKSDTGNRGYASGFEGLIKYIEALLPAKEVIISGIRQSVSTYPSIAIRESVANTLIHQDLSITGTGPIIEIFENRIEFTNPGIPLIDIKRIIDNPPKSRNEKLAFLMRRSGTCEELGTGWDKIVSSCEFNQLPAPKIVAYAQNTKVILYASIPYNNMSTDDKMRACYWHACLKYVSGEKLTNQSLRERFGLPDSSSSNISRLIKECVEEQLIKPFDPNTAPKHMKYIPEWA